MPARLLNIQASLQGTPLASHPGGCESQAAHVPAQPQVGKLSLLSPEIVQEPTRDGVDYRRICAIHQWCSLDAVSLNLLAHCPFCACELEERQARLRYAAVTTRLTLGM